MKKIEWLERTKKIFGPEGPGEISGYCLKNWQEETNHIFSVADRACQNVFQFDFNWDMERTIKPVYFPDQIDWSLIPEGDREFLWQFNRHRFLLALGQAYLMSQDEKYARNYIRLLEDWIDHAMPGDNIDLGPWRTLETGIRAETWMRSLPMILKSEAVEKEFLARVFSCLRRHQKRLAENFGDHKYISNWGVLESCGLFLLSLVLPDSEELLRLGLKRLEDGAAVQVLPDGMQWEQSPMYHNEVYHCYLTALYYGDRAGITMPDSIRQTVKKMAYVNYQWMKPDHTQFAQGDSDASDLRDQITAGAAILCDGTLKSGGYQQLDFENAWLFGYQGCKEYAEMKAEEPDFLSVELPFGGNYYFRSSWDENGNLLHFHCGDTGGGHGHADKLHIDLVMRGEDLLIDSGRYTYVDGEDRYRFKEAGGHNVTLVDECGFAPCETSWSYKKLCTCIKQEFFDGKQGGFVEGSHLGYWEKGVFTNRKIIWLKPDIYVVCDDFLSHGTHTYESLLHFSGHGKTEMENGNLHFTGDEMEAYIQFLQEEAGTLEDTEQSYHYNEKHPNKTYCASTKAHGFFRRITVINGGEKGGTHMVQAESLKLKLAGHQEPLAQDQAEGLRISDGKKEYVLFLCHQEVMTPTDILCWGNCRGYGKAVLFDRSEEKNEIIPGEILAW